MPLMNRPYIGTWVMNRTLVRHSPDCVVQINGYQEFATCPSCNNLTDLQKYITQVSVDASVEGISSANLTLSVPRHEMDVFSYDGNYVLQPALEVVIFLRGYFPMTGIAGYGQDADDTESFNANDVPVYPYYQVFRGVVTSVSHDFNGGFYTATLQCANLLHFWQNLKLSVNGAVFGKRADNSMVEPSLIGHKFTSANPYAIIYTLIKVGFGAAFGVDFQLSQGTNVDALGDDNRTSLYKHAAEWWERRWTEHSGNLRMYGIDGSVFNAFEQAYLGAWYDTREKGAKGAFYKTAKSVYDSMRQSMDLDPFRHSDLLKRARDLGYDPLSTRAAVYDVSKAQDGSKVATEDVLRMQAFNLDIGKMGSVNMFETEYMSKMEIAEAVKTITGYEFYQDVDGDLVFKPPMYNMDTRDDPVYRIADRDLISITETEGEPECTIMKGTGSQMANISGHGLEGWLGVGGVFIDYRLVAKFGYREGTFESNYMNNRQALFLSAINRLDLANVGVKNCSITIPLRPELRPGYPVYVEHLDCFYYVNSMSHSFQYGGQCTTTIQGVAKRAKWLPPMKTTGDGSLPSIDQVRLDAPDEYPAQPLYGYPHLVAGQDTASDDSGPPRVYGFPNVVLALDPEKVNLDTVDVDTGLISAEGYVDIALKSGFLETGDTDDTFILRTSNTDGATVTLADIQQQWNDATETGTVEADPSSELGAIIQAIQQRTGNVDLTDSKALVNYLSLQTSTKGLFAPGTSVQGKYRYYSCSHKDEQHQAPANLRVDQEAGEISYDTPDPPDEGFSQTSFVIVDAGEGQGIATEERPVKRGIRVASLSQKADSGSRPSIEYETISTADVRFLTFGPQVIRKQYQVSTSTGGSNKGSNFALNIKDTQRAFEALLNARYDTDQSKSLKDRFASEYERILFAIQGLSLDLGVVSSTSSWEDKAGDVGKALDNYPPTTIKYWTEYVTSTPEGADTGGGVAASRVSAVSRSTIYRLPRGSYSSTVEEIATAGFGGYINGFPGFDKGDKITMRKISNFLAQALGAYTKAVMGAARKSKAWGDSYEAFMEARFKFISSYTDGQVEVSDSNPGVLIFHSNDYEDTGDMTPIFPVSDSGGYEVYGSLPYGRGVTIEKYGELLESTTSGNDTDDGTEAAANSVTLVGTTGGSNASDLVAVEKFMVGYLISDSAQAAFAGLTDSEQAAVLASLNTTQNNLEDTVETLQHQDTAQNARIRNSPVTSFARGMSSTGDTAAANLANLDVTSGLCRCKGVDASYFMAAFSQEFVQLYDDPAQGYLEEQAQSVSESWGASREAFAGSILDTRNTDLAAEFTAQGKTSSTYANDVQGALNQLSKATDEAREAAQNLQSDLDGEG